MVQLLKEGCGILSSDEADHTTAGSSGKMLLRIKLVLKENNMEQDVLTLLWNILRAIKYSTIPSQQIRNGHLDMCHHSIWELVE